MLYFWFFLLLEIIEKFLNNINETYRQANSTDQGKTYNYRIISFFYPIYDCNLNIFRLYLLHP